MRMKERREKKIPSGFLGNLTDEERAPLAPYLTLMTEDASRREHSLREVFNGLRWIAELVRPGE